MQAGGRQVARNTRMRVSWLGQTNRLFMPPTTDILTTSISTTDTWVKLQLLAADAKSININEQLNIPGRPDRFSVDLSHLYVDLSKNAITEEILQLLLNLAEESQVIDHARKLLLIVQPKRFPGQASTAYLPGQHPWVTRGNSIVWPLFWWFRRTYFWCVIIVL